MKKLSRLKSKLEPFERLEQQLSEIEEITEILRSEQDEELQQEADTNAIAFLEELDRFELTILLSGEYDDRNAFLEINAGAGGSEACDWAAMLLRMYLRWAESRGFKTEIISETPGDSAGYRGIHLMVEGLNAYGYLRSEHGVHRLVRISPFDSNARRHTSFARVEVLPETDESEVEIDPAELRIDTLRAGGAGGQHVNKTESAVRITHIPTGIVVSCQNERSQHKNRESAMKVLASRLLEVQRAADASVLAEIRGDMGPAEWGRQIRSYVMQPYTMVKDHRTGHQTSNVQGVLDGEIDEFVQAFLSSPPSEDAYVE